MSTERRPRKENREAVFTFCANWVLEKGYWPRPVDIASGLNMTEGTIRKHLLALEEEGRVHKAGKGAQSWVLGVDYDTSR